MVKMIISGCVMNVTDPVLASVYFCNIKNKKQFVCLYSIFFSKKHLLLKTLNV